MNRDAYFDLQEMAAATSDGGGRVWVSAFDAALGGLPLAIRNDQAMAHLLNRRQAVRPVLVISLEFAMAWSACGKWICIAARLTAICGSLREVATFFAAQRVEGFDFHESRPCPCRFSGAFRHEMLRKIDFDLRRDPAC